MVTVLKRKVLGLMAVLSGLMVLAGCDEDREIKSDRLPDAAKSFISQYFPAESILYAEKDRDDRTVSYSVRLSDGTEIDFDEERNGLRRHAANTALWMLLRFAENTK